MLYSAFMDQPTEDQEVLRIKHTILILQKQLMSTKYFLIHTHFAVGRKGLKNAYFYTSLLVPGHDPPQDITIFMDVSLNPGLDLLVVGLFTIGFPLHKLLAVIRILIRVRYMKYSRKISPKLTIECLYSLSSSSGRTKITWCSEVKRTKRWKEDPRKLFTVFFRLNAPGVYLKLGLRDPAFI